MICTGYILQKEERPKEPELEERGNKNVLILEYYGFGSKMANLLRPEKFLSLSDCLLSKFRIILNNKQTSRFLLELQVSFVCSFKWQYLQFVKMKSELCIQKSSIGIFPV